MTRMRVIVVLASLVLVGIVPARARSQNPSSLGWSSMSMFNGSSAPRYGLTSQSTPSALTSVDADGDRRRRPH